MAGLILDLNDLFQRFQMLGIHFLAADIPVDQNIIVVDLLYDNTFIACISAGNLHAEPAYFVDIHFTPLAFALNSRRIQAEHNIPPYGRSGRLAERGIFLIAADSPWGTPANCVLQWAQIALPGFLLRYCSTVFAPGVRTYTLLNVLDRYIPLGIVYSPLFKRLEFILT